MRIMIPVASPPKYTPTSIAIFDVSGSLASCGSGAVVGLGCSACGFGVMVECGSPTGSSGVMVGCGSSTGSSGAMVGCGSSTGSSGAMVGRGSSSGSSGAMVGRSSSTCGSGVQIVGLVFSNCNFWCRGWTRLWLWCAGGVTHTNNGCSLTANRYHCTDTGCSLLEHSDQCWCCHISTLCWVHYSGGEGHGVLSSAEQVTSDSSRSEEVKLQEHISWIILAMPVSALLGVHLENVYIKQGNNLHTVSSKRILVAAIAQSHNVVDILWSYKCLRYLLQIF